MGLIILLSAVLIGGAYEQILFMAREFQLVNLLEQKTNFGQEIPESLITS